VSRHFRWLGLILASLVTVDTATAQPELAEPARPTATPPSAQPPLLPPVDLCGPPKPEAAAPPVIDTITFEDPPPPAAKADDCCFYVGTDGMEYLLCWLKSGQVPPLVTRSRAGPPILGLPDTRVIAGGEPVNLDAFSGGRFTLGSRLGYAAGVGTEYTYFFLGTRTTSLAAGPTGGNVGRPVINAVTGAETFVPVSGPTVGGGAYTATMSARAQGIEANVVTHLLRGDRANVTGLVGYRFLQVHEGLFVGQSGNLLTPGGPAPFHLGDQVDAHNRFHGGQIGLRADARKGPVFVEVAGKVAFGATTEVVRINGLTGPTPVAAGGLLALPSNSGRVARDVFAVVPEAGWKFGFEHDKHRVFVGYDFLYLSDGVRAGDQIDRVVNLGQVPVLGGSGAFAGPERPRLAVKSTDLWLQGLMIGMETRW
jgi:hypothetical protein